MSAEEFPQLRVQITAEMVSLYGQVNGDRNQIHYDPEVAAAAGFTGCVAHGAITVAILHQACRAYFGDSWLTHGRLKIAFTAPVMVGDTVETRGLAQRQVEDPDGLLRRVEVSCTRGDGETVLAGEAHCR